MPNNLISRIEGLLEKATPGPISLGHPSTHGGWWEFPIHVGLSENRGNCFARFGLGGKGAISSTYEDIEVNAQLYIELRNAAPALMKALKAAQAFVKQCPSCGGDGIRERHVPGRGDPEEIPCKCVALRTALAELEERDATK
jgi:hypothetical protein